MEISVLTEKGVCRKMEQCISPPPLPQEMTLPSPNATALRLPTRSDGQHQRDRQWIKVFRDKHNITFYASAKSTIFCFGSVKQIHNSQAHLFLLRIFLLKQVHQFPFDIR